MSKPNLSRGRASENAVTAPVTRPSPVVTRPVLHVAPEVAALVELPTYGSPVPSQPPVIPVRSYSPEAPSPKRQGSNRVPVRQRFNVADELAVAYMGKAVVIMFDLERRDASGSRGGGSAWPIPTLMDRNTDYAPESVVLRPTPLSSAEVQFRDDVADLIRMLAKADVLKAKLVAGRALRTGWSLLQLSDPLRRGRTQLYALWRAGLLDMVNFDRAECLNVCGRCEHF